MRIAFSAAALAVALVPAANAELVVSEIMQNPRAVSDSNGEWFEVSNLGDTDVNMLGYTVMDLGTNSFTIDADLIVSAGGTAVLGRNDDVLANGGVDIDYVYSGMDLANGDDEIVIEDDLGAELDRVEWDGGPTYPDPNGASMSLVNRSADNNDGNNWFESGLETFGDGDFGSPGGVNEAFMRVAVNNAPESAARGGQVAFDVDVENPTEGIVGFDAWVNVVSEGIDVTPVAFSGIALPAGLQRNKGLALPVPTQVALGDYTVSVNLGTMADNTVNWSDSFVVTITD